ncbi:MAG: DUF4838 domain-containing protein [Lentisphaerae bacterium]|nr:DUF4838 domain-containing protein [Lentisphaerota bacterium]
MRPLASRQEMRQAHPEYYAMFKGERRPQGAHVCYSSEALIQENVRYARALFDLYDYPMVSVMPEDGFTHACECPECLAQRTPDRGAQGRYSDYVWNYVNRVAQELMKTHPEKLVSCCAYSTYRLPPEKIERFSPNVVVGIVGGRAPWTLDPDKRAEVRALQQAWAAKTEKKIFIFENYPFTNRMKYFIPRLFPHGIAQSMREVRDISFGESIWMGESRGLHAPEFNHLNYYVTARMYWDIDADIDELLEEYCRLYFGPAAEVMRTFIEHCQAHAGAMRVNPHPSRKTEVIASIDRVFELLHAARARVEPGTVYAERIDKMAAWLSTLQEMRDQIAQGRENVPELAIREIPNPQVTLDGQPDEPAWQDVAWQAYRDLTTGEEPVIRTFFKAFWGDNALYLAIRCEDPDTANLSITAPQNDDTRIWRGDAVELLLETDEHSFYQMVVDPAGSLTDLDRNVTKSDLSWNSQALVSARIAEDAWYLEMKIPVVDFSDDPLNNLVGHKPTREMPWHFNFCRQRLREDGNEFTAFAPTGSRIFAVMMKFAKMYVE